MNELSIYADYVDYFIIGFLGFLSVVVITVGIERMWFYSIIRLNDYEDKRELELDLHRRLTLIATIGSNAPYIGLLGTVIGIMITFASISDSINTASITLGLALALKATALGLVVAIPAIVLYNFLLRKSEIILIRWDIFKHPSIQNNADKNPRMDKDKDLTLNRLSK